MGIRSRCNDCGTPNYEPSENRESVCKTCMDLRGKLIEGMKSGKVSLIEFKEIQGKLAGRSFKGANMIRVALGMVRESMITVNGK